ncbi:MAG: CBS domain-containing protein [Nitrosarchaeum sp.]|nr:CBS domain-containing protein [Nitrosarchaeum sp.]
MAGIIERYLERRTQRKARARLRASLKDMLAMKACDLLQPHPEEILPSAQLRVAFKRMAEGKLESILVMQGKEPQGILLESAFITPQILTATFMSQPVSSKLTQLAPPLPPGATLADAFTHMVTHKTIHILVQCKDAPLGILSSSKIAKHLDTYYSIVTEEVDVLPKVKRFDLVQPEWVSITEPLEHVIPLIASSASGSVICHDTSDPGNPRGIITPRDIIQETYRYGSDLRTLKAVNIMKHPVVGIEAQKDLFEANRLLFQRGFRRLAVTESNVVLGIITPYHLFSFLHKTAQEAKD